LPRELQKIPLLNPNVRSPGFETHLSKHHQKKKTTGGREKKRKNKKKFGIKRKCPNSQAVMGGTGPYRQKKTRVLNWTEKHSLTEKKENKI